MVHIKYRVQVETYSNQDNQRGATTNWWCSVRNKQVRCPAAVSQKDDQFRRGSRDHVHQANPGLLDKVQLTRQVKDAAAADVFKSAPLIIEEKIRDSGVEFNLPQPDLLARVANRFRQKGRPDEPRGMDFQLAEDFLPEGFLRRDLTVDGARHIIFATDKQLEVLQQAKRWYVDGTFKVLRHPDTFEQLFSIHAFIKSDGETKQVPLVFVFMSRKRKKDYKKVLKKIKSILPAEPLVKGFVLDFEAAVWKAIRHVFPTATVSGCAFHWTQAVWRKVQALGMSANYQSDAATHRHVRQLLALPLLPGDHIERVFLDQRAKMEGGYRMTDLLNYVQETWISGTMWAPADWSVYGQSVRTNNDCEGWHRRLNYRTTGPPPFYLLVSLLHDEADYLKTQLALVGEKKLKKIQRKSCRSIQARIFHWWDLYQAGGVSADKLLKKLSSVYGPQV